MLVSCLASSPAGAVTQGTLDAGHRYVGMLAHKDDGRWFGQCSGFYGGDGTFVTAAHCVDWLASEGIAAEDLGVTFDTDITWNDSEDGAEVVGATFHSAVAYAYDDARDYAAIRLAGVPDGVAPATWPAVGRLDRMKARGGLRPRTVFDTVGYGVVPAGPNRGWNTEYQLAPGRMATTSRFQTLSDDWLKLNTNDHIADNGGPCFGDSGGPALLHGTDTVVAFSAGGHNFCWGYATDLRLDTRAAREFYGAFIAFD